MKKIKVAIIDHNFNGMPIFLARLTQRGHKINSLTDLTDLYLQCRDKEPSKKLLDLPHTTIQRMCHMTVAIFGLSTKAVSQLRTHAKRATFISTSTQYSDFTGVQDAYTNPFEKGTTEFELFESAAAVVHDAYERLTKYSGDKDKAGYLLPQGLRKCLIIDANFPDWKYILQTRLCNRNTREVQYTCQLILQEMERQCGKVWADQCLPTCCSTGCKEGYFCCGKKYEDTRRSVNEG